MVTRAYWRPLLHPLEQRLTAAAIDAIEAGRLPDSVVRHGVRQLLRKRLQQIDVGGPEGARAALDAWMAAAAEQPIALLPDKANEQHYEVPAAFFQAVLGAHLKYSCCLWQGAETLDEAEAAMLALSCQRAELADGMRILELGCGWGSLSLWMAANYPGSEITAMSNSAPQRAFIQAQAQARGLSNLRVITADINDFAPEGRFDRVVSVEMFEHVRNHALLLSRIADWLRDDGKLFVHIFCHREHAYAYQDGDSSDWMARHFFSGGMMPADSLLLYHQQQLALEGHWRVSGTHYQRTSEAWLARLDASRERLSGLLRETYGGDEARWFWRWRLFFIACAELFGYRDGAEWWVSHYRFGRAGRSG